MDLWATLLDLLILLGAALVLGAVFERLRQNAIIGYLLAGTLLGPNALNWISHSQGVEALAELGVALLLFTIGLEFSWRRLRSMGAVALGGGTLQVVITMAAAAAVAWLFGLPVSAALAIGAMIALSSTACVLRLLTTRAEIESVHGRSALGILLMQDIAVVPLVLMVSMLGGGGSIGTIALGLGRVILLAGGLFLGFYLLFNYVIPRALDTKAVHGNRELPILMAIVVGLGSAWTAHALKLSPALGAFLAGMLLAESPFATQIRADVASLRTLLMTLFFSSIGMLGDPAWIAQNWLAVTGLLAAIVLGKTIIIWPLMRIFGRTHRHALATGLCLAQVGEFSFVLAAVASDIGVIREYRFMLIVSATIGTLFFTPYLVALAPTIAHAVVSLLERRGLVRPVAAMAPEDRHHRAGHVIIIGFGPAGQAVAETMMDRPDQVTIVDLNPHAIRAARRLGFHGYVGDASHADVLQHLDAAHAVAVIITSPDPAEARTMIQLIRAMAPGTPVLARARYHVYRWELEFAGAHVVIDEEQHVGARLAEELSRLATGEEPRSDDSP